MQRRRFIQDLHVQIWLPYTSKALVEPLIIILPKNRRRRRRRIQKPSASNWNPVYLLEVHLRYAGVGACVKVNTLTSNDSERLQYTVWTCPMVYIASSWTLNYNSSPISLPVCVSNFGKYWFQKAHLSALGPLPTLRMSLPRSSSSVRNSWPVSV